MKYKLLIVLGFFIIHYRVKAADFEFSVKTTNISEAKHCFSLNIDIISQDDEEVIVKVRLSEDDAESNRVLISKPELVLLWNQISTIKMIEQNGEMIVLNIKASQ